MALTGDALPDWLLACDIVASIEAASRLGDRKWRALLDAHYAILRAELDRFGGREIDTAGDGLFAAYTGPARDQLRLRDARCGPQHLAGIAVHTGARVEAAAQPSEVLVSAPSPTW